ncbi:prostaglandin F2 receptor negative regulator [Pyxicephalus adspersus]|uniref:prostaglandin F2 receptor negative regulator n=1 Tax=Pyxicephalus adspersus TaxID=30357 RepID=UPI003B5A7D29
MRSPEWRTVLLIAPTLIVAVWSRIVRVPTGPLLRVEGTDVALSCNVSDYEGPKEQNFEWIFSSDSGSKVKVLSTWDDTFTDPELSERVRAGGIQLQRSGNSEAQLWIRQLRVTDEGNYTCSTPSTDATVSGNYEDHVQLRVIPDTLRLQGPKGRTTNVRNVTEGGSFQLQCQAAMSDSATHTHLSVTWERQTAGTTSEVLALTHLGRFQPGPDYAARYNQGAVRLDTPGSDKYQLTVEGAQATDGGDYSCVAQTWVQGPNGWEKIQEKRVGVAQVVVQPMDLTVTVSVKEVVVPEGDPIAVPCQVSVDSDIPVLIQVRWFRSGEIEEMISGLDPEPSREKSVTHKLEIPQARISGDYLCRGYAWTPLRDGNWKKVAEGASSAVRVQIVSAVPDTQVTLNASILPQMSDEPAELVCHIRVSGDPRLSVSWYFTPYQAQNPASATSVLVGTMSQDWTLQVGELYQQRQDRGELIFSRPDPNTFALRIQWTSEEDRGSYHCVGTVWKQQLNNSWAPVSQETSKPIVISWAAEDFALVVNAKLVQTVSAAGGTFEMMCTVQPKNIPFPQYTVQVMLRPQDSSQAPVTVISLSREGITHRRPPASSNVFLEKGKEGVYIFRLLQAQNLHSGAYQCDISAWTQGGGGAWRMVRNQTTNPVQLEFQNSGPVFNVSARSDNPSIHLGERSEFWCIITIDGPAVDPADMAFDVSWYLQRPGSSSIFLAGMDRTAQVRHNRRNSSSEVALERISDMEYRLRVYGCEEEDTGGHYCTVTPWVRTGEGVWSTQEMVTSSPVPMSVRMDLLSAFKYPLLIGASLSLVAGLLSCLIGYCSSRYCCKAQPVQEKRREHRRLMSMEMD